MSRPIARVVVTLTNRALSFCRRCLPRPTARLRLTLFYGGLFLVSGIAVLAITYALVWHATSDYVVYRNPDGSVVGMMKSGSVTEPGPSAEGFQITANSRDGGLVSTSLTPEQVQEQDRLIQQLAAEQRAEQQRQLVTSSGLALAVMLVLSMVSGWLLAGRVLRPVRTISATARKISAGNLHQRLALDGPNDEFKELGNTLDDLLGRLEASFEGQRHFVANASHELRTPLTVQRALLQVALGNPQATADELRSTCEKVLESGEQQQHLIDALLTLASSERDLDRHEPVDLAGVAEEVLEARAEEMDGKGLRLETTLSPAVTFGDPSLIASLVANLVDNAVKHNSTGGHVRILTGIHEKRPTLLVSNSGPVVAAGGISRLVQPFQRLAEERTGHHSQSGHGLGLAIVKAVAAAHGSDFAIRPREGGGIEVEIRFSGSRGGAAVGTGNEPRSPQILTVPAQDALL
jgi:signal transduction histidine kinase